MNKRFITIKELFTLELVGLPNSIKNIISRSKKEFWEKRKRKGKGGGYEYEIASMPKNLQIEIYTKLANLQLQSEKNELVVSEERGEKFTPALRELNYSPMLLWRRYEQKNDAQKARAKQRFEAVKAVFMLNKNGDKLSEAFEKVANSTGISVGSLRRYYYKVIQFEEQDWLAVLLTRDGENRQSLEAQFSQEAWEFFKADYLRLEKPQFGSCYERLKKASLENGWDIPSPSSVKRKMQRQISQIQRTMLREGAYAVSRMYPSLIRSVEHLEAMEWVNGDGYKHNVFVRWHNGEVVRPKTWLWQDVRTRKILAYRVDLSENSDVIRLSLMDLIAKYGIPKHLTIDNTRAVANKWLTGGVKNRYRFKVKEDDPLGIVPLLGIKLHWTSIQFGKGHGQAKPIERAFSHGGLGELVDKHPLLAGHYAGASPIDKPDNYNYKDGVAYEDFIRALIDGIDTFNNREGRQSEICKGVFSFNQVFKRDYAIASVRKASVEQIRMLMLMSEATRLKQDGTFELNAGGKVYGRKNRYFAQNLIGSKYDKVVVKFDPQDLHNKTWIYDLNGIYLGEAICTDKAAFDDKAKGREHDLARKQFVKANKMQARALLKMESSEVAMLMPEIEEEEKVETSIIELFHGNTVRVQEVETRADIDEEEISVIEKGVAKYLEMLKK